MSVLVNADLHLHAVQISEYREIDVFMTIDKCT